MANPQFIEQTPISLVDVKEQLKKLEKRDKELNYLSNKCKEYTDAFVVLDPKDKEELYKKLVDLNLTIKIYRYETNEIISFIY